MKIKKQTRYMIMAAGLWLVAGLFSAPVLAQTTTACDPQYYMSLESRAWMEAQREIEQNQNLIVKPDSVLEYTCFDKFGSELAQHALDMFSETQNWGPILSPTSMDNALSSLVGSSLVAYQKANFVHDPNGNANATPIALGGRGENKHQFNATISGGAYTCNMMDKIWQKSDKSAKCYNFQTETQDGFFTFKEYEEKTGDDVVRKLPQACAPDSRWADQNKLALGQYLGAADRDTPWNEDREFKFLDITKSCDESPTIQTGLSVQDAGNEVICLIPGCVYDPDDGCVAVFGAVSPGP